MTDWIFKAFPRREPGLLLAGVVFLLLPLLSGCGAIRAKVAGGVAESLAISSAQDEDPEFVRDALPMGLKLLEASLLDRPGDKKLLLSACSGFTQYAQAFIVQPADFVEDEDLAAARRDRSRASRMFQRARGYCLRAFDSAYKGTVVRLSTSPGEVVAGVRKKKDVPLLFWTGASWAAAISVSRQDYELVADLRVAHELLKRALALDPEWDDGAIHEILISLEAARDGQGGSIKQAREHFRQVREISGRKKLWPLVALAESVSVKEQNLAEFKQLLEETLAYDLDSAPDYRLGNTLAQRRARWLLGRIEDLFVEAGA